MKNVCTLYAAGKKAAILIPDRDGWEDDEVKGLVYELVELGIKRKFADHTLKDVEI